jgi:cytochrome c oxidase accessory protein FixG
MSAVESNPDLLQPEERVLSTLERDGSRRWLRPRLAPGRFLTRRRVVAYLLIAIFTITPYLKVRGKPVILLDVVHRRFTLMGVTFLPTDMMFLALFMVSVILSVFLLTALMGRVWCGWACPQTVYMEFLFRPVERLFTGRSGVGGKPRGPVPVWRLVLMYATYFLASFYLAHTFLSYFVGVEALRHWVFGSPADHLAAFIIVVFVTGMMLFNFGFFREQTCIIACPYGRLQSVLLDRSSLIISYDKVRGEPRGAVRRTSLPVVEEKKGDCVDCDMCVSVCPTGIDIRDGLQIECIGCAQCIDACDTVMKKVGRATGLIRYSSQAAMAGEKTRMLRPRVIIYPSILLVLVSVLTFLLATRAPADVTVMRGLGLPFVTTPEGGIENTLRVKLTNRADHAMRLDLSVVGRKDVVVSAADRTVDLAVGQTVVQPVHLIAPRGAFRLGFLDVTLRVSGKDGTVIDRTCRLLGPMKHEDEEHEHDEH